MKQLSILGIALAFAYAAGAFPTLTGPTGLASLPTAAIAPTGQFQFAADWYDTDPDTTLPLRLLYGAGDNLELGATLIFSGEDAWGINGKYVTPLDLIGFNLAIGAQHLSADADFTQIYFVGTRAFGDEVTPLNGTVGLNWTRMSNGTSEEGVRVFLGIEAILSDDLRVAGELQTRKAALGDDRALWSLVGRYAFSEELTGQLGVTNGPIVGGTDHHFFLGAAYTFGAI
jgi:hypothetical protein